MKTKQSLYAITVILILGIGLNNCTKKSDIIKYGQISGKVKSSATGEPISGAGLSLSPSNSSTTTGSDGAYSFVELEPQQYSIQVIKDGYQTNTTSVEVVAGENRLGDILITPAQPVLSVSTTLLDFGTDKSILPFEIRNNGAAPLIWNVAGDKPWISINPASGTTSAAGVNSVNITVDRSLLGKTSYAGTVSITSNGGSASISITVNVVNPVLYVSTTLLDFGSEQSILPFEIKNNGASELIWSITSDKPWLTVNPASGNVTTGTNAINASIDRSQIGKSTYVGTLVVNSNGGTATINVTVNVNGPLMNITPSSLVFGATDTEKTLQISNIGIGNLTYNAQTTQSWISFQNGSGSTTTEIKLMPVIVNRQGLSPGDYSGTIVINSNANNITLNISMIVAAPAAPQLTIGTVSNISSSSADISGNITNLGSSAVTQHGHCWSTATNPTIENSKTNLGGATTTGGFTSNLTELSPGTTYYVRAYAINSVGTTYSSQIEFTTDAGQQPNVTTSSVNSITMTTAMCGGNVTYQGGTSVSARGVCWSTNQSPTILNNHTTDGSGMGNFISQLEGLSPAVTYYVRAYATNNAGTAYGNQVQFTTTADLPPTVITTSITAITAISATGGGNVTSEGGSSVSARGVCWSTSQSPTILNSHTTDGSGTGNFISQLEGLSSAVTYYVRAYATNNAGTAYGIQVQFTTSAGLPPTVITSSISDITAISASGGGNVTSEGGTSVSARGVCWSTNQNPTISNSFTIDGNGTGSFNSDLTNLAPLTNYYVRAYATNMAGTSYGTQVQFTTVSGQIPTVSTSAIMNITHNSATGGGNVSDQGTTTVTARGVCWSTNPVPTLSNSHTTDGSGTGSFNSSLTSLEVTTTYYARAYATNSIGTAYGNEVSFTTLEAPPVVTDGLIAYYTFDQQNANDWTGNYNGVNQGVSFSADVIPGTSGYSADFNGTSFISLPVNPVSNVSQISVALWMKSSSATGGLFQASSSSISGRFRLLIYNSQIYSGSNPFPINVNSLLLNNQWHLFSYTKNSSIEKLYIDGNLVATGNNLAWTGIGADALIGKVVYGTGEWYFFSGKMDNLRLYNRELSQSEIQQIFNANQ